MDADLSVSKGQGSKCFRSCLFQLKDIVLLSAFFFFFHFQILMSSYNEALQQMTAAPREKAVSVSNQKALEARHSSLLSAILVWHTN